MFVQLYTKYVKKKYKLKDCERGEKNSTYTHTTKKFTAKQQQQQQQNRGKRIKKSIEK